MTTYPFQDAVAIDTNVFVHLRNPRENPDRHIHHLLGILVEQSVELLVDNGSVIQQEHVRNVIPMLEGRSVDGAEAYLLQYFMDANIQRKVVVNRRDGLMAAINRVIFERSKNADRTFVYIAFIQGKSLITNDMADIVEGPAGQRTLRRDRLFRETRGLRAKGADIYTSQEAHAAIQV